MKTSAADIKKNLKSFILEEFLPGEDEEDLTSDVELITTGILDSVSVIQVVAYVEEQFGIKIEAHEASVDNMNSIGTMAALVSSKAPT